MRDMATIQQLVAQSSQPVGACSSLMIKDGVEVTNGEKKEDLNKGGGTHTVPAKLKRIGVLKLKGKIALTEKKILEDAQLKS